MKGEANRTVMIYVDSYENGVPTGQFHILSQDEVVPFKSMTQLLLGINGCLDEEKFPQAFSKLRKFQTPKTSTNPMPVSQNHKKGEVATFSVRILFRQNASWQGLVTWIEHNMEESFRSVLELMMLMDTALTQEPDGE